MLLKPASEKISIIVCSDVLKLKDSYAFRREKSLEILNDNCNYMKYRIYEIYICKEVDLREGGSNV